jgi:ADP-ribosyl-[dinitrogen reductase] hydrolase
MRVEPPLLSAHQTLRGSLVGGAVGDALGLPAEGIGPRRIRRLWKGNWRMRLVFKRGMFSDDTEHTYAVTQALAEHPGDAVAFQRALAARLRWWFVALPAGVGMATAKACIRLWFGVSPAKSGVFSAGNGPAMRSAIIGTFFRQDPASRREFVRASARLTHTDPKAEAAAQAVASAAACAANSDDRQRFVASLADFTGEPEWTRAAALLREHLALGSNTLEFARVLGLEQGVTGYGFHTVPVALYAWLRHPGDFAAALTSALDCGGDTDTVGAIVGGIAGAGLGAGAIPREWRENIRDWPLSAAKLDAAADALGSGKAAPGLFWPARMLRNAVFLAIVLLHGLRRLLPPY